MIIGTQNTVTVNPDLIEWKKIGNGVYSKHLSYDEDSKKYISLFKIESGARLKKHRHVQFEWAYVLEGVYEDEYGSVVKGNLKINSKDSVHTSKSKEGCILLVYWCGKHERVY